MAMAICFKCGSAKSGALIACRSCNAAPRTNSEYAVSLALSDHLSSKNQLAQYSHELRNGQKLSVPREALVQALDALKDHSFWRCSGRNQQLPLQHLPLQRHPTTSACTVGSPATGGPAATAYQAGASTHQDGPPSVPVRYLGRDDSR